MARKVEYGAIDWLFEFFESHKCPLEQWHWSSVARLAHAITHAPQRLQRAIIQHELRYDHEAPTAIMRKGGASCAS